MVPSGLSPSSGQRSVELDQRSVEFHKQPDSCDTVICCDIFESEFTPGHFCTFAYRFGGVGRDDYNAIAVAGMKSRNFALAGLLLALIAVTAWHFNHQHAAQLHRAGVLSTISKEGRLMWASITVLKLQ